MLKLFRKSMPSWLRSRRRFPTSMEHATIGRWAVEECLVWIRLGWRHFFSELGCAWTKAGNGTEMPGLCLQVGYAWEKLEQFALVVLDRRGTQSSLEHVGGLARRYLLHLRDAKHDGLHVFSYGYVTITTHLMACHVAQQIENWGNLWESWAFVCERFASFLNQFLRMWNHKGSMAGYLVSRMQMKDAMAILQIGDKSTTGPIFKEQNTAGDWLLVEASVAVSGLGFDGGMPVAAAALDSFQIQCHTCWVFNSAVLCNARFYMRSSRQAHASPWEVILDPMLHWLPAVRSQQGVFVVVGVVHPMQVCSFPPPPPLFACNLKPPPPRTKRALWCELGPACSRVCSFLSIGMQANGVTWCVYPATSSQ
jgi:hypothetical protein